MTRVARWMAVLMAGALVLGACGGDDKLSGADCAEEQAKLFDEVDDLGNVDAAEIAEKFAELEEKGCTDGSTSDGDEGGGASVPSIDPSAFSDLSEECIDLSQEAAAKGLEAINSTNDPDKLREVNEELEALNQRLKEECPEFAGGEE
jgi:hypothetical protein